MAVLPSRHISVAIERPFDEVYRFLAEPGNLPQWASGLGQSFERVTDWDWSIETPEGRMLVRFTPTNAFGIVDHTVIPDSGAPMPNPMRVLANGDGAEVVFTLFRRDDMTEAAFEHDAEWVRGDLAALKKLLEG